MRVTQRKGLEARGVYATERADGESRSCRRNVRHRESKPYAGNAIGSMCTIAICRPNMGHSHSRLKAGENQCKKAQAQLFLAFLLAPYAPASLPRLFLVVDLTIDLAIGGAVSVEGKERSLPAWWDACGRY